MTAFRTHIRMMAAHVSAIQVGAGQPVPSLRSSRVNATNSAEAVAPDLTARTASTASKMHTRICTVTASASQDTMVKTVPLRSTTPAVASTPARNVAGHMQQTASSALTLPILTTAELVRVSQADVDMDVASTYTESARATLSAWDAPGTQTATASPASCTRPLT
jgi:hypothetical protein